MQQKVLWELQEVDQSLERISGEIKQRELVIKLKKYQAEIAEIQNIIDKEEKDIAKLERDCKKMEQELASLEAKKNEREQTLYAGNCSNTKELEGMKVKLEVVKAQVSQMEDEILMNMDILEDKVQLLNRLGGQLAEIKKVYTKGVKLYKKNKKEFIDAKTFAEERQTKLEDILGESLLQKYQRVQRTFKNTGIARVENGLCSGCRVEIPILHLKNIKEGNNIYTCEQCGRILINWEEIR